MPPVPNATEAKENARQKSLHSFGILDSLPEQGYEDVTELAAFICGTPISLISFVDGDRQWFKSEYGLGARETPRSQSFCAHTIPTAQTLVVPDASADPRFRDNPLVLGNPNIRFYAGAPIVERDGHVLGTVCVIDTEPRVLSPKQISALEALARQVMVLLDQRKNIAALHEAIALAQVANRVVRESEQKLQTFVASFPTLAWIANPDGYITWYNNRWYEYTGTAPEDMAGWGWQSVHDPAILPAVMERWSTSIETHQPFEMVFPLRGADGVFRSFLTRVNPIKDEAGTLVEWFGTNTEIDELHRTRQALQTSEAGLNQVLTATNDAVVSVDRTWCITYLNPMAEQLYGPAKELTGKRLWEAFPEAVYEGSPFIEHYHRAMDHGVAGRFEAEYGEHLTLGTEVYPTESGIVTFSRDVTKLKQATAAALQNEKLAAVGRLASSIAHEINNPLEAVTNLLYLARRAENPAELDEFLELAERELRRVAAIANQTLRFHKQSTKPTPVTCQSLFDDTLRLYQGRLINSDVKIERRHRCTGPVVCFEGEIRQVLSNLLGNAIDAMPNGGRLLLRSRNATHHNTGEKGLVLTVGDTGSGMSPAVRRKIFEAFFSTKGIGGTGLGLWVSQGIVTRHQGTMTLRTSDQAGCHGTVFRLFLPFETPASASRRADPSQV